MIERSADFIHEEVSQHQFRSFIRLASTDPYVASAPGHTTDLMQRFTRTMPNELILDRTGSHSFSLRASNVHTCIDKWIHTYIHTYTNACMCLCL